MKYYQTEYSGSTDLFERYNFYLNELSPDWGGRLCLPTKQKNRVAMEEIHKKFSHEKKAAQIVNDALKNKNKVKFWSDQHFFHSKIIEYGHRPFISMSEMHQKMIKNYVSSVDKDDVVFFGGDVSFGHASEVNELFYKLPGKKILILGNHDVNKGDFIFKNRSFFDAILMCFELIINEKKYWLTHYPINELLLLDDVINIHGHTHQFNYSESSKYINISVEKTKYSPITL